MILNESWKKNISNAKFITTFTFKKADNKRNKEEDEKREHKYTERSSF